MELPWARSGTCFAIGIRTQPRIYAKVDPSGPGRARPYLYGDQEIQRLLMAATALPSLGGLRGATYHCLFGLLTVTGLRISDAIVLEPRDVDLQHGVLTIRGAKFGKSRLMPLHLSSQRVLARYARRRDRHLGSSSPPLFLVNDRGRSLESSNVRRVFYRLSRQIGLRGPTDRHGQRLHDFRHRFAVRTLNALVSIRPGRRTTPASAVDLLGTCPYRRHPLLALVILLASLRRESSNQLLESLEEWNRYLER